MKTAIALAISLLLATGAYAAKDRTGTPSPGPDGPGLLDCTGATPVTCGDTATGDVDPGGNVDNTYGCTTLGYSGCTEVVYEVCLGGTAPGDLTVDMTYAHSSTNDLDMFLLGSCNETDCLDSSTAVSGTEQVSASGLAPGNYYVVVDGWNSGTGGRCDPGTHDISVTCNAPCATPVEPTTWGEIKARHTD